MPKEKNSYGDSYRLQLPSDLVERVDDLLRNGYGQSRRSGIERLLTWLVEDATDQERLVVLKLPGSAQTLSSAQQREILLSEQGASDNQESSQVGELVENLETTANPRDGSSRITPEVLEELTDVVEKINEGRGHPKSAKKVSKRTA